MCADLNKNHLKLKGGYLFPEIQMRSELALKKKPKLKLLNLGIGDISEPIPTAIIEAICKAAHELGRKETLRGYGPSSGYDFLKEAIWKNEYVTLNITKDEIFISDGSKCDIAAISTLFSQKNKVAICDPVYPVYVDTSVMAGRTATNINESYRGILYLPCKEETGFLPKLPNRKCDLIYLCSPNNPTGAAFSKGELKKWIDFAKSNKAIIFFDGAYEAFIREKEIPHSIYEIKGADEVAIEMRSFSKTASFTSLRCSYLILPKKLRIDNFDLHPIWKRRVDTQFGGVAYPIQRGAEAVFTSKGKKEVKRLIDKYMERTAFFKRGLEELNFKVFGGENAPYIWCKTPSKFTSWNFFNELLEKGIICTPGSGFGKSGEGYVRFSCFATLEHLKEALFRLNHNF